MSQIESPEYAQAFKLHQAAQKRAREQIIDVGFAMIGMLSTVFFIANQPWQWVETASSSLDLLPTILANGPKFEFGALAIASCVAFLSKLNLQRQTEYQLQALCESYLRTHDHPLLPDEITSQHHFDPR